MSVHPILKPPHLSADAKRRYATILALGESHPRRVLLLAMQVWWLKCVGHLRGDLEWYSAKEQRNVSVSDSEYELLGRLGRLLEAWIGKHGMASKEEASTRAYVIKMRERLHHAPPSDERITEIISHTMAFLPLIEAAINLA